MMTNRQPDPAQIRKKLDMAFDDSALSAFCLDYFSKVYDRFSRGMRKDDKITLLLDDCRRQPTGFETLLANVRKEYTYPTKSGKMSGSQREELKPLIDVLEAYIASSLHLADTTKDEGGSRKVPHGSRRTHTEPKVRPTLHMTSERKIALVLLLLLLAIGIYLVAHQYLDWSMLALLAALLIGSFIVYESISRPSNEPSEPSPKESPPDDQPEPLTAYLEGIVEQVRWLNLSGIDPSLAADARRSRLFLPSVYIELETLQTGERGSHRVSVVEVMRQKERLVLLGDPGSGKSTFVNFVALCMAGQKLAREDANLRLLGERWERSWLLPVRVVLRDFVARGLPEVGESAKAEHLWRFLEAEAGADFAAQLGKYLRGEDGKAALILLDGFDEVPEAQERRKQVMDVVEDFVRTYTHCRFLLTSRTYAWDRQGWQLPGFAEARLAPFSQRQIEHFIDRWYAQVRVLRHGERSSEDAQGRAALLKQAIAHSSRLTELASSPLLLTLMTSLHAWRGGDLPEKREKLYDNALELLLYIWDRPKIVRDADGKEKVIAPAMQEWLKVERNELLKALERVGYEAHAGQLQLEGTADIAGKTLAQALWDIKGNQDLKPKRIMEYIQDRAGLLLPVGLDVYKFPHRSFQEYLAARYLAKHDPDDIAKLTLAEPERWQEVVLLTLARIAEVTPYLAWQVVNALAPQLPSDAPDPKAGWAAYIAAVAIIENDLHHNLPRKHQQKVKRLQKWLVVVLEQALLPPIQRAAAAYALAHLGDPRDGVTTLPPLLTEAMQSAEMTPFQAAVYPITNAQFAQFVEAQGYHESRSWSDAGRLWLQRPPESDGQSISKPAFCHQARLNAPNQPVVGISYYEAEAFCRWLSHNYGRRYRLPTEKEWQRLAQGDDARAYPWGNEWKPNLANSHESGIRKPSAVGLFPKGASPTGAHDCAGNVWEWCASWYAEERTRRVLRGGSWDSDQHKARNDYRFWSAPSARNHLTGFRVVVSVE